MASQKSFVKLDVATNSLYNNSSQPRAVTVACKIKWGAPGGKPLTAQGFQTVTHIVEPHTPMIAFNPVRDAGLGTWYAWQIQTLSLLGERELNAAELAKRSGKKAPSQSQRSKPKPKPKPKPAPKPAPKPVRPAPRPVQPQAVPLCAECHVRPCYVDGGTITPFCSRKCRDNNSQKPKPKPAGNLKCKNCRIRDRFKGHDFCGRRCAAEWAS